MALGFGLSRLRVALSVVVVAAFVAVALPGGPAGATGTAHLHVTIDTGGQGLSADRVQLCDGPYSCVAQIQPVLNVGTGLWDADFDVDPGSYTLGVVALWHDNPDFSSFEIGPVTLAAGANPTVSAAAPIGGRISGTVVDSSGAPLNAMVDLTPDPFPAQPNIFTTTSEHVSVSGGAFSTPGLPAGNYKLVARPNQPGQGAAVETVVTVTPPGTVTWNAQLAPGGTVSGHVYDPDGNPLPAAGISVGKQPFSAGLFAGSVVDANGAYLFGDLLPGSGYSVKFSGNPISDFAADPQPATVVVGTDTVVDVHMYHGADVTGHVTDVRGNPVAGAEVQATALDFGDSATTDASGAYSLGDDVGIPSGTYTITASANRQPTGTVSGVVLTGGVTSTVDLSLVGSGAVITGTVTDEHGAPVAGATVSVNYDNGGTGASTDVNGTYVFTDLPDGTYTVSARAPNLLEQTVGPFALVAGQHETANLQLQVAGTLSGRITDGDGHGIANANISVSGSTAIGTVADFATTDPTGHYALSSLRTGDYTTYVSADGFAPLNAAPVSVTEGATTPLDLTLAREGVLDIVVRNTLGVPIPGASVFVSPAPGGQYPNQAVVDNGDGTYRLGGLAEGVYSVYASSADTTAGLPVTRDGVVVSAGTTTSLDLQLEVAGSLSGHVSDSQAHAIVGATVYLQGSGGFRTTTTNGSGDYSFSSYPPGPATLAVFPPSGSNLLTTNVPVTVLSGGVPTTQNVVMQPPATINGTATTTVTGPFSGQAIVVCPTSSAPADPRGGVFPCTGWAFSLLDGSGHAHLTALNAGTYNVAAAYYVGTGFAVAAASPLTQITLAGGDTADCTFVAGAAPGFGGSASCVLAPAGDTTNPTAAIATPISGASFTVGQVVHAAYSCADLGGSLLASCVGTVANGSAVDTSTAGSHTLTVNATDGAGNHGSATATYTVLAGDVSGPVSAGDTVTTDPGGLGASPAVPVQTSIVVPTGVSGSLSVTPQPAGAPPSGFEFFGSQLVIDAPPAAGPSAPYVVTFTIDASLLGGVLPGDVQVFRNGLVVGDCTSPTSALPDPCVASRTVVSGGDVAVTVRTTHFSTWALGRLKYSLSGPFAPVDALPTINVSKAGSAVPVKFALGGGQGLQVFVAGSPSSGAVTCGAAPSDPIEQTVTVGGSSLSYDASSGRYTYVWKTEKSWTGCRDLVLRFRDGTTLRARFQFK